MRCTTTGYKSLLVCCNVIILFIGVAVFILGLQMKGAMSTLRLIDIPIVMKTVMAVIVAGFFISLTSLSGICGACYELNWMLAVHLLLLGVIVVMEFSLGITLMVMKKAIDKSLESSQCNSMCVAAVDGAILDYALPSAGLMVSIIFVEAVMVYSAGKLYYCIRDGAKASTEPIDEQTVQMENVSPPPAYVAPPTYVDAASALQHRAYLPVYQPAYVSSAQPMYAAAPQPMLPQMNMYNTTASYRN